MEEERPLDVEEGEEERAQHNAADADVVNLDTLAEEDFETARQACLRVLPTDARPADDANPRAKSYTLYKEGDEAALGISVIWSRSTFYVNPTVTLSTLPQVVQNTHKR